MGIGCMRGKLACAEGVVGVVWRSTTQKDQGDEIQQHDVIPPLTPARPMPGCESPIKISHDRHERKTGSAITTSGLHRSWNRSRYLVFTPELPSTGVPFSVPFITQATFTRPMTRELINIIEASL